ncbi:expressed unknown protein [Seminavis robusta]|uniref:Uncharacterized protein n=1 Tax=Seminavis robusta TaxID=568900 RepID=A0A9N8E007_9STRA|nr:expressed unknown protein [Seminavis robusta]|eukprot:Sro514_g158050.1 n/a (299) ;mRNA; f:26974-27870
MLRGHNRYVRLFPPGNRIAGSALTEFFKRAVRKDLVCAPRSTICLLSTQSGSLVSPTKTPTKPPQSTTNTTKKSTKSTVIYRRHTSQENRGLRAITAFSLANTSYFTWYAGQCLSSEYLGATVPFYVLPEVGLIGFVTSVIISWGCYTYAACSLVSKLTVHPETRKIRVWFHTFPFWNPAATQNSQQPYDWGDICLDRRRKEVIHLLQKLGGDVTKFSGYLPLYVPPNHPQSTRWPIVLHLRDGVAMSTIRNKDLFLETLLVRHVPRDDKDDDEEFGGSRNRGRRRSRRGNRRRADRR